MSGTGDGGRSAWRRRTHPRDRADRGGPAERAARVPAWRRPVGRPSVTLLATEPLRAGAEYVALQRDRLVRWFGPTPPPAGDGHPVIVFPGLATDAWAVEPLVNHLRALGWRAEDWGQGLNTGPTGDLDRWLDDLAHHVGRRLRRDERGGSLVGWSLGGLYARELAKRLGGAVRHVITMGTPFAAAPDQTHASALYRLLNGAPAPRDPGLHARLTEPPPQPTTSIYSRRDGIVPWQGCVHPQPRERLQDIEVDASHMGMGWNPKVLAIVTDRLAVDPDDWRPYPGTAARRDRADPAGG